MRNFETGATRDDDTTKIDPEAFLAPNVLARYFQYMNKHRVQADGKPREGDNWQKGIPATAYIKSMFRHFLDVWLMHRGFKPQHNDYCKEGETCDPMEEALCAIMFNVMGYLYEYLMGRGVHPKPEAPSPSLKWHQQEQRRFLAHRDCDAQGGVYCPQNDTCYPGRESYKAACR